MPRRLAELLAQAKLAERDIERERIRARRDSQNFATATQALSALLPAAGGLVDAYGKRIDEDAALEGGKLVSENLTATGDANESPEDMAKRLVAGRKELQGPEKSGDVVADFMADPLGLKARAAKRAAVDAQGNLASQVKGNRDAAAKLELDRADAESKRVAREGDAAAKKSLAEERQRKLDAETADKRKKEIAANIESAARRAVAEGQPLEDFVSAMGNNEDYAGVGSSQFFNAYSAAKQKQAMEAAALAKAQKDAKEKPKGVKSPEAIALEQARLEKAKADAEKARAEADRSKAKPEKPMPSVNEAHGVTDIDSALRELGKLKQQKSGVDTGPIANVRNWLAQKVGVADPNVSAFKSRVGEQVAQYIKGISGATVAKEERAALLENVPTMDDHDEIFMAKLDRVIDTLNGWRDRELSAIRAAGKATDQFGAAPPTEPAAPQLLDLGDF